jgi:hypothetical protein
LFKAICSSCSYNTKVKWPINTTNLSTHFKVKHFNLNSSSNIIEEDSNLEDNPTLESSSINTNNTLNSYFKTSNIRKRPDFIFFSKEEYKNNLLSFILSNNLPFSIVESNSFNNLLKYIKDDLPNIGRTTIRKELDIFYNLEITKLKVLLNKNYSRFSITLDE